MSYPVAAGGAGLGADLAAQRTQLLTDAFNRGDTGYLLTWINDVPAHPAASVQLAKQLLSKLQVPQVAPSAITFTTPPVSAAPAPIYSSAPVPSIPSSDVFSPAIATSPDGGFNLPALTTPIPAPNLTSPLAPAAPALATLGGGMSPMVLVLAAGAAFLLFGRRR